MEGEESPGYSPSTEAESRSCDGIVAAPAVGECQADDGREDSAVGGATAVVAVESVAGGEGSRAEADVGANNVVGKRKRGRPPKGQAKQPAAKKTKVEEEDEDVCFICFDGGSLVLCDRRGCPKAYHPACIKRDEAFFRSRAKWNCGWHICSSCQKAAHYMCYTCTYSLCKACVKDADYLCVRERKGFCALCMKTILLIENVDQGNKETAQVDFDDKGSWEYLFKMYWSCLKEKLSLTLDELTRAQNPWKAAGIVACKGKSLDGNYGKVSMSHSLSACLEANNLKGRMSKEEPNFTNKGDCLTMDKSINGNDNASGGSTKWASKELLEFVAHMKSGDISMLSKFDVQSLLLDYIVKNNLRDPHQKSQIICDLRLRNLFGRQRLGHFDMLKLLEFHFLNGEDAQKDVTQSNTSVTTLSQLEGNGDNDNLLVIDKDMKDSGKFHEKVVGSIVRIRISDNDQKQDKHRLVPVVGTHKVAVPYTIGERTVDFMLEILNLGNKETIAIDAISNQEFSDDECRQLCQNIKCGLLNRLTLGQVQEKAMALQEVRLNDWLEMEVMRLNQLLDEASKMGHKKELRDCVQKLELLKTPEEHRRRLHEIPVVHADPNMDPNRESDYDGVVINKKQDEYVKQRCHRFSGDGGEPVSPQNGDILNGSGGRAQKKLATCDQIRNMCSPVDLGKGTPDGIAETLSGSCWNEGEGACGSDTLEQPGNEVDSSSSVVRDQNNQAGLRSGSLSGVGSETSIASLSTGSTPQVNDSETDKLWHYRDQNGKVQGPFCLVQLRQWTMTGFFLSHMRIWNINEKEGDSLLLTDVLNGRTHKVSPAHCNVSLSSQEVSLSSQEAKDASHCRLYYNDGRWSGSMNITEVDGKQSGAPLNCDDAVARSNDNDESVKNDMGSCHSSDWTTSVVNNNNAQAGSSSQCWDSLKVRSSYSDHPQVSCPVPSSAFTEWPHGTSFHRELVVEGQRWNSSPNHGHWNSHANVVAHTTGGQCHNSQANGQDHSSQSSADRHLSVNYSSNNWDSNSGFPPVSKSTNLLEQIFGIHITNLPGQTPRTSNGDGGEQITKDQQPVPLNIPVQDTSIQNPPSPRAKPHDVEEKDRASSQNMQIPGVKTAEEGGRFQATESKQTVSSNCHVQNSGPSWSSASSLVISGGTQLPDLAGERGQHSSTCIKPAVEEWDSGFVPVSSQRPHEGANDHTATPTSKCDELTPSSFHPASTMAMWQAIGTEPIEFSTLAEESLSDLLAEVDAMESQRELPSPTSAMNCGEELFQDSKTDCFASLGGLSLQLGSGKGTCDNMQLYSESTHEPLGPSQADTHEPVKNSCGQSSTSTQVEVQREPIDVSVNKLEGGSNCPPPAPPTMSKFPCDKNIAAAEAKSVDPGRGAMRGDPNSSWGRSTKGNTILRSETAQPTSRGNSNGKRSTSAGFTGRESHPKFGGSGTRSMDPRDWAFQSGNSGFSRGRSSWSSRQSSFGSSGGGGSSYSRSLPKGHRVCKFYENGYCKKGASCDYLHPL
ncbi:zinc finger CCCH domain-containing protein 44-like isoform X2 [Diospyros lotus]|uniref:zinc finger CCCH domain-containing protein 44-like isoform X2 n=1 Tax=Diospyros lotus TaxID=55363 RepID=UPI00225BB254|nr:zinc finger CCCH domain-containing protein 44-like isoform X2 [Diospyros lotus]